MTDTTTTETTSKEETEKVEEIEKPVLPPQKLMNSSNLELQKQFSSNNDTTNNDSSRFVVSREGEQKQDNINNNNVDTDIKMNNTTFQMEQPVVSTVNQNHQQQQQQLNQNMNQNQPHVMQPPDSKLLDDVKRKNERRTPSHQLLDIHKKPLNVITTDDISYYVNDIPNEILVETICSLAMENDQIFTYLDEYSYWDPTKRRVFVRGLSYECSVDQLREAFEKLGTIEDATIISDKFTGKSKGYGFVTFANAVEADEAVKMGWLSINGRNAQISLATPLRNPIKVRELSNTLNNSNHPLPPGPPMMSKPPIPDQPPLPPNPPLQQQQQTTQVMTDVTTQSQNQQNQTEQVQQQQQTQNNQEKTNQEQSQSNQPYNPYAVTH